MGTGTGTGRGASSLPGSVGDRPAGLSGNDGAERGEGRWGDTSSNPVVENIAKKNNIDGSRAVGGEGVKSRIPDPTCRV